MNMLNTQFSMLQPATYKQAVSPLITKTLCRVRHAVSDFPKKLDITHFPMDDRYVSLV